MTTQVTPPQTAEELVEAILKATHERPGVPTPMRTEARFNNIRAHATRLAPLLAERDEAVRLLCDSANWLLDELRSAHSAVWVKDGWEQYGPIVDARARIAALTEAPNG